MIPDPPQEALRRVQPKPHVSGPAGRPGLTGYLPRGGTKNGDG